MLRRIPRSPRKITATQLADALFSEGHEVSKRTVERDLLALQSLFPLACDDRDRPFGWSWTKDAPVLSLPGLTPAEALAFQMASRFLEPLLPASVLVALKPHFELASKVLSTEASSGPTRKWKDKVRVVYPTQVTQAPQIARDAYDAITEALLKGKQLRVRYGANRKDLDLHPLALVQRGPVTYVVATAFSYDDPRLFVAHRFSSAKVLEVPVRESTFDLDTWIAHGALGFGQGKQIKLVAVFKDGAVSHLAETPLSADQQFSPAGIGKTRLTATVADTPQLLWWLRGFGADVEVVLPLPLRVKMATSAVAISVLYSKS